jgi:hypothetical protein
VGSAIGSLGQQYPEAATLAALYTVPAGASAVLSTVFVCNQSSETTTFRLLHSVGGLGDTENKEYLYYEEPVDGYCTFAVTLGITMSGNDILLAQSANGRCSFNVYGESIT